MYKITDAVLFSCNFCDKILRPKQFRKKGGYFLIFPYHCSTSKRVRIAT